MLRIKGCRLVIFLTLEKVIHFLVNGPEIEIPVPICFQQLQGLIQRLLYSQNLSRMLIELIEIHNVFEAFIRTENLVGFHRRITVENRERLVLCCGGSFPSAQLILKGKFISHIGLCRGTHLNNLPACLFFEIGSQGISKAHRRNGQEQDHQKYPQMNMLFRKLDFFDRLRSPGILIFDRPPHIATL